MAQSLYRMSNLVRIQLPGMVSHRSLEYGSTIGNLPGEHRSCHTCRKSWIISFAVLLSP
jgi:hypothetical protein